MVKKGGVELILRGIGQLGPPWTGNDGLFALIDEIPSSGRNYAEVAFILITPISVDGYTFAQTGHKVMSSFTEPKRLASHLIASTVAGSLCTRGIYAI